MKDFVNKYPQIKDKDAAVRDIKLQRKVAYQNVDAYFRGKSDNIKSGKKFLKHLLKKYSNKISKIHKNQTLNFKVVRSMPEISILLYKNPSHNRRQSSAYYLGIIDNNVAYIRKSNHWGGVFFTNIYAKNR